MIDYINFYVCDRKKECNTSPRCGTECFHTLDKEHEQKGIRKGKWLHGNDDLYKCSECGSEVLKNDRTPYCPICGAKMEE